MGNWLMKTEPNVFSIQDLAQRPDQTEPWDGVRNFQARNMLRDEIRCGDRVFFYHSNCVVPGIVGLATVVREGYPDDTALNPKSPYYDPRASAERPIWYRVDVKLMKIFERTLSLSELKTLKGLETFPLVRKGNRLSVMPVSAAEAAILLALV
jgi:predicted RNA-binding protein with PUA-like domain